MHQRWKVWLSAILLAITGNAAQARPEHPKWPPKTYAIYYGPWNDATISAAQDFDCIIFHPGADFSNISPDQLARLRAGKDGKLGTADDVIALGYVSIGEDERPPVRNRKGQTDTSGPMIEVSPGKWEGSGKGYPGRYLDQQSFVFDSSGQRQLDDSGKPLLRSGHDGIPDENGVWGSYYTYAGDPVWRQEVLERMSRLQTLGADGFFLDTVDTASPFGAYGGTQKAMIELLQLIRSQFPQRLVVANRGMFLLDKYPREFGSSIDGMLFESLYTVWDWQRSLGVLSPYSAGDFEVYQKQVLPAAKKYGFYLLFVNYLNPLQSDFFALASAAQDVMADSPGQKYFADPLLAKLSPPTAVLLPDKSVEKAPILQDLKSRDLGGGRFELQFSLAGLGNRKLGKDYFLDLRGGEKAAEVGLLPALPFDYAALKVDGSTITLQSYGLEAGNLYLRGVGTARGANTAFQEVRPATDALAGVSDLQAFSRDRSVLLKWKNPGRFRIYQGDSPGALKAGASSSGNQSSVENLTNGQTYFFAVASLGQDGKELGISRPVSAQPRDWTPPLAPTQLEAKVEPSQLNLKWVCASSPGITGFKVYCCRRADHLGVPIRVEAAARSSAIKDLDAGDYWVAVSAVDGAGNESPLSTKVNFSIPATAGK